MSCYCANYYGSLNCQNMVSKFGDQCSLCLAQSPPHYEQFELDDAVIGQQWLENYMREQLRGEDSSMRERVGRAVS